jgi:glutamate synthase (ferredoxin)
VGFEHVVSDEDREELTGLIEEHVRRTASPLGKRILDDIEGYIPKFKKVIPHDYKRMMNSIALHMSEGMSEDEAKIEAFHENTAARV